MYTALGDIAIGLEVENEIRQAVLNGKIAITHQSNIQVPGWSGAGYLILDPDLMDGSYKISGGGNGGGIQDSADGMAGTLGALLSVLVSAESANSDDGGKAFLQLVFDFLGSIIDWLLKLKVFGILNIFLALPDRLSEVWNACNGSLALINFLVTAILSLLPFVIFGLLSGGIGAILYVMFLGAIVDAAIEKYVFHVKNLC